MKLSELEIDIRNKIALTLLPGVGPVLARNLVSYCGSVEAVFSEKKSKLVKIPGIGMFTAEAVEKQQDFSLAEKETKFVVKHKIQPLFFLDDAYPHRLKACDDAPILMYYKGNFDLNHSRMLGIVGTRRNTHYGEMMTEKIINELAGSNVGIISGMAYGIDIIAHRTALNNGLPTVGVLAHGLDQIYPPTHKPIAVKMIEEGGLLTEYMSNTRPIKENFPSRNRIVAGMIDAIIVIESAEKGGALITANIAEGFNRDVFALPGRINDEFSVGCNNLIRTNKAMLLDSAQLLLEIMNWQQSTKPKKPKAAQLAIFKELKEEELNIVNVLRTSGALPIDAISIQSKIPVSKVATTLLTLEFSGLIKAHPGKIFELID